MNIDNSSSEINEESKHWMYENRGNINTNSLEISLNENQIQSDIPKWMPIIDKIPDNNINSEEYIRIMAQSNVEFGNLNCNNILNLLLSLP